MSKTIERIGVGFAKAIIPAFSIVAMIDYHETKVWAAYLGFFMFIIGFIINETWFANVSGDENGN